MMFVRDTALYEENHIDYYTVYAIPAAAQIVPSLFYSGLCGLLR